MLFPEATLAVLRAANEDDLPHAAIVLEVTRTKALGGEVTDVWLPLRTLPCRVTTVGGLPLERLTADQLAAPQQWRVVFAAGADVTDAHRLTVTGADAVGRAWTLRLNVESVSGPEVAETQRTALCTALSGGAS